MTVEWRGIYIKIVEASWRPRNVYWQNEGHRGLHRRCTVEVLMETHE